MKTIKWLLFAAGQAALFYLAFIEGINGALNIVLFLVWGLFLLSFFVFNDEFVNTSQGRTPSVPRWLDVTTDLIFVGVLVWFGHVFTAMAYMIHILFLQIGWDKILKEAEQ